MDLFLGFWGSDVKSSISTVFISIHPLWAYCYMVWILLLWWGVGSDANLHRYPAAQTDYGFPCPMFNGMRTNLLESPVPS